MAWGIADTASQIEKIRAESSDYLGGLDSVGEIDYSIYCKLWDFYHDLLGKAYEQGLKDAPNDKRKDAETIRHGRWYIDAEGDVRCTACKTKCLRDDIGINITSNYCPSCGAQMSEEKENER